MLIALDVKYQEQCDAATVAAIVFQDWCDPTAVAEYTASVDHIEPYVPGEFFRRELPCLLRVLRQIREPVDVAVIDGYVRLAAGPGLGMQLWLVTDKRFAVVGVAKSRFRGAGATAVTRGASKRPLYVSAVGIRESQAVDCIARMHGDFRTPTLLKRAHELASRATTK